MLRHSVALIGVACVAAPAPAHFPFIVPDAGGSTARLVMSETLRVDPDVPVSILKGAALTIRGGDGEETALATVEAGDSITLPLPGNGTRVVHGVADLGVTTRGGARPHVLVYYPKTIVGDAFEPATRLGAAAPVELVPVRAGDGVKLRLDRRGAPIPDAHITVIEPGGEPHEEATDAEGCTRVLATKGRYGAWARDWADEAGDRDGKAYDQVRRYATLVFDFDGPASGALDVREFPAHLPRAMASFGAVENGGWLYVYGGHTADRHEYSRESVSGRFHRLKLDAPDRWEELEGGPAVQGMNLAAGIGKIYRVGGMEPRNAPGDPPDNYSIGDAASFDPQTGRWTPLVSLPRPRSSHDIVVVGDRLIVVGGWSLRGRGEETEWPEAAQVLDLGDAGAQWRSVPQPFSRRALVAAAIGPKVYVIGGFDRDDSPSLEVDVLDTRTMSWSKGPPIPGPARNGFGPAACAAGGTVYLSVATGDLYRLATDGSAWEPVAKASPRIVHRLVAWNGGMLIIGGASGARMTDLIERVRGRWELDRPSGSVTSEVDRGVGAERR